MKKKSKGKKYTDFDPDEFKKKQNNKSCSKLNKQENDINNKNNQNQKLTFKNSLEKLVYLFQNFSRDMIEDVYNENNQNFSKSKDVLKELCLQENNENKINDNDMHIEEEEHVIKKKSNKKKKFYDISEFSNLEVVASDESLGNDKDKTDIHYIGQDEGEKEQEKEKNIIKNEIINDENNYYNELISLKEKNGKTYSSIFDNDNFNYNIKMNSSALKDEPMIDDYLFNQNIDFLCNCFPEYKREEIIKKICDLQFDINSVVSNILNETYQNETNKEENKNFLEEEEIEAILANYEDNEEFDIDDDFIQIQKSIENSIKTENINKKNNIYCEEDYEMKKGENETLEREEYFLNKNIDEIQTPQIRNDLKKLINHFPKEEIYNIKLAYYSYMDYKTTFDFFDKKDGTKNLQLKFLINNINKNDDNVKSHTNNKSKKNNINKSEEEKRRLGIFKKILEKKPINWNFEKEKNINKKDFIIIRNRLYQEARNAFANKKYGTGQLLLRKAKRYQQEIEQIARNQGINTFYNNNRYNNNSKQIDLHGLTVQESKYIVESILQKLRNKKIEDNLKFITLTIITGKGSHSEEGPVLFPELLYWLKEKDKIKADGKLDEGAIYVTIF